jgi:hypothetical protein
MTDTAAKALFWVLFLSGLAMICFGGAMTTAYCLNSDGMHCQRHEIQAIAGTADKSSRFYACNRCSANSPRR